MNEDKDFDIKVYLYDFTDDKSIAKESDSVRVDDDQSEILSFEFEHDLGLDETNNYAILAVVEDGECQQEFEKFNLNRDDHDVIVESVSTSNENLFCGGSFDVNVETRNIGIEEQDDVKVSLKNTKLRLSVESKEFTLDGFPGEDSDNEKFQVDIPDNIKSGEYTLNAEVRYKEDEKISRESITVSITDCLSENGDDLDVEYTISLGNVVDKDVISISGNNDVVNGIKGTSSKDDVGHMQEEDLEAEGGSSPIKSLFLVALVVFLGVAGFVVYVYWQN